MSTNKDAPAFPNTGRDRLGNIHPGAGLTAREHAAIQLRVPDSGTDWLDKMILESMRDELARANIDDFESLTDARRWAGNMLAERSKT